MPYNFLNATRPIQKNPKDTMISGFNKSLERDFKVSSDWFTILREEPYASGVYEDIDVRINTLFQAKTAIAVGDDYKKIIFQKQEDTPTLGSMFQFDNNYWIVSNIESLKNLAVAAVVKRCNNVLRWKDFETGNIHNQPCSIDYLIKETRDYSTGGSSLVQPSGFLEVFTQFNEVTNKIRPSRRFLFGNPNNWNAFKIMGGGVNNYNNSQTFDDNSVGILRLSMLANQVNYDTDDVSTGTADSAEYIYSLTLNTNTISLSVGSIYNLIPTVELNGTTVSKSLSWVSTNDNIVEVDTNGVLTPISSGSATITCSLSENPLVYSTCSVTVSVIGVSNYVIVLSPSKDYIYENEEETFTTTLYLNGVAQPDVFVYTLNTNGVPTDNFQYNILSGNTFWVNNLKRYDGNSLIFTATSGLNSMQIPIKLKGAW